MKEITALRLTVFSIVSMSITTGSLRQKCYQDTYIKTVHVSYKKILDIRRVLEDTNSALIEQRMEDIVTLFCFFPSLLVSKYQVNPLMQMSRNIV